MMERLDVEYADNPEELADESELVWVDSVLELDFEDDVELFC